MRRSTASRIARDVYGATIPDIRITAELRRMDYADYASSLRTRKAYHLIVAEWMALYSAEHPKAKRMVAK